MKTRVFLLAAGAATALAQAQIPIIVQSPAPSMPVISPLTPPAAQSGQALLSQINATLTQRSFEHQALTLQAAPAVQTQFFPATPQLIRVK